MTTITAFIKRYPRVAYYTLTFAISWGGMLLAIGGPGELPGTPEQADQLMGIAFSLLAGPSVAGVLLTGLVSGWTGLQDLLARLLRWRVAARWFAVALLTAPLLTAQLTAYRMLMVWVYDRTESLLVTVLMHASLIVSTTPILVPAMTGVAFLTWFVVLTVALWVVVAAVVGGRVADARVGTLDSTR